MAENRKRRPAHALAGTFARALAQALGHVLVRTLAGGAAPGRLPVRPRACAPCPPVDVRPPSRGPRGPYRRVPHRWTARAGRRGAAPLPAGRPAGGAGAVRGGAGPGAYAAGRALPPRGAGHRRDRTRESRRVHAARTGAPGPALRRVQDRHRGGEGLHPAGERAEGGGGDEGGGVVPPPYAAVERAGAVPLPLPGAGRGRGGGLPAGSRESPHRPVTSSAPGNRPDRGVAGRPARACAVFASCCSTH